MSGSRRAARSDGHGLGIRGGAARDAAGNGRVWLFLSRAESENVEEKRENRARLIAAVERHGVLRLRRLFAGLDVRLYAPRV